MQTHNLKIYYYQYINITKTILEIYKKQQQRNYSHEKIAMKKYRRITEKIFYFIF